MRIFAVFSLAGALCISTFADKEPSISHLPVPVQDRIKERKGAGEVKRVRTSKQPDGSNHYEIEYKERGAEESVTFAEDGSVITESSGKGKGKGRAKDKDKEKGKKDNKSDKRDKGDDDDDNATVSSPTSPVRGTPPPTPPTTTRPNTTERPVTRPTTRPSSPVRWGAGQTRYIYWDNIPEAVRTAALAQQPQYGTVNVKALRVQTSGANTVYHVPYARASVSFSPNGTISIPAANSGGAMQQVGWDSVSEPVRAAAAKLSQSEGDVNSESVFRQSERGKTLYHIILEGKQNVFSFSPDGQTQNPATYWR
ncbi:MAG: hypothetical protein ACXW3Z_06275 [Limisphaerales bacterium]